MQGFLQQFTEVELLADAGGDYTDGLTLEVTLTEQKNGQGNFSAEYDSI